MEVNKKKWTHILRKLKETFHFDKFYNFLSPILKQQICPINSELTNQKRRGEKN